MYASMLYMHVIYANVKACKRKDSLSHGYPIKLLKYILDVNILEKHSDASILILGAANDLRYKIFYCFYTVGFAREIILNCKIHER